MRYLMAILVCVLILFAVQDVFTNPFPSGLPWSAPALLCDSIGDNLNPSFARGNYYFLDNFNILVWERSWADSSQIFLKDFANPASEIAVTPAISGVFNRKPTASVIYSTLRSTRILIVWQSNVNGNYDLFSTVFQDGQFKALRQITTDGAEDVNPALVYNELVWERDSSIYYSRYSPQDSTWSAEVLIDGPGCSNPTIAEYMVAYQKRTGNPFGIFERTKSGVSGWNPPALKSLDGDNRNPRYSYGLPLSLIWQHRDTADWNLMNIPAWSIHPILYVFSAEDEMGPAALELPYISATEQFAPLYFSFQSPLSGDREIYANDYIYDESSVRNISQSPGEDRRPAFSEFSHVEADTLEARAWLAWESFRNGKWQIWGSFAETDLPGLSVDEPSQNLATYRLYQNYPNPFNPTTVISWQLAVASEVELTIYNLLGQKIRTLVNARGPGGFYEIEWDGRDDQGRSVASGIYIYQLQAKNAPGNTGEQFQESRKMLLLR